MKKLVNLSFALSFYILLSGCREIPPIIDFGDKTKDTTYISANIPLPVKTKIFIEDLTGVRCQNCPKAAERLKAIMDANPDNTVALGVYFFPLFTLTAPWENFDTLNTIDADVIYTNIYNSPGNIPIGGVNRKLFNGETSISISSTKWSGYADLVKAQESPVIIGATVTSFDDVSRKAIIHVKVTFTKPYSEELDLSVYLTESKIISKQSKDLGVLDSFYVHNHVLRKSLTSYPLKVNSVIKGNYEAGRVFEKDFEVVLKNKWKKENCSFAIIVNGINANTEVVQAEELHLD